jgi:glycosyltransferase involved in cell wall biosynthesis
MTAGRFAIITPYFREPPEVIQRCIESVKRQTLATSHFVVSDGYPQDWLDGAGVRHLRLGLAHGDFGNTPRGLGALLAISEGYEAVGFLDADNWYEPDHVEQCCTAANAGHGSTIDIVAAKRRFLLPDGTVTHLRDEANHIDTNCYWFLQGAFHVVHYWTTMVSQVASLGDRVFCEVVRANQLAVGHTKSETVNYVGNFEGFYRALGWPVPPGAKPNIDARPIFAWIMGLDDRQQRLARQRCGIDLLAWARENHSEPSRTRRNEPCPCGSGRRYKHCHGAYLDGTPAR